MTAQAQKIRPAAIMQSTWQSMKPRTKMQKICFCPNTVVQTAVGISSLALIGISIAVLTGAFPGGPILGYVTLGVGAAAIGAGIINVIVGTGKATQRIAQLVLSLLLLGTLVTLGSLGAAGVLSAHQVALGVICSFGSLVFIGCCCISSLGSSGSSALAVLAAKG